jgi:hypothetical protein
MSGQRRRDWSEQVTDMQLGGRAAPVSWSREAVPESSVLPTVSLPLACLSAVCRARYASPTPVRVEHPRPCEVKAAQGVGVQGVGALALALTRMVSLAIPRGRQRQSFFHQGITIGPAVERVKRCCLPRKILQDYASLPLKTWYERQNISPVRSELSCELFR